MQNSLNIIERPELALRPYQEDIVNAALAAVDRGRTRMLAVAATGTGKTPTFAGLTRRLIQHDPSATALVICHRREILQQIAETMRWAMPEETVGVHCGEERAPDGARIVAASVQSIGRAETSNLMHRLRPNLVICDEAHHAPATTYQNVFRDAGCFEPGGTLLFGVTATPHRLDNAAIVGGKAIFEEIIYRYDIQRAVADGWLVDLRGYRAAAKFDLSKVKTSHGDYVQSQLEDVMDVDAITETAITAWEESAHDRQTIVFCAGVDHARHVAEAFQALGVRAEAIWGDMPKHDRDEAIERFRCGKTQVLTNMDILTEGFDARECSCVVLLRPTKSWTLYTQMVGRGLRPLPGIVEDLWTPASRRNAIAVSAKQDCVVIDVAGITSEHDLSAKHTGTGTPSLQALVGLPESLELEGMTICEAVLEFEQLPPDVQAAAFRKKRISFSGLKAVLTQVQLLSELDVADEASDAGAEMYWLKTGEFSYRIEMGQTEALDRDAVLTGDMIGRWTLSYRSINRATGEVVVSSTVDLGQGTSPPFDQCERHIGDHVPFARRLGSRSAPWRSAPVTDAQIRLLRRFGIEEGVIAALDRGHASAMISRLMSAKSAEVSH